MAEKKKKKKVSSALNRAADRSRARTAIQGRNAREAGRRARTQGATGARIAFPKGGERKSRSEGAQSARLNAAARAEKVGTRTEAAERRKKSKDADRYSVRFEERATGVRPSVRSGARTEDTLKAMEAQRRRNAKKNIKGSNSLKSRKIAREAAARSGNSSSAAAARVRRLMG